MCGIVGFIGKKSCIETLYDGLARLEYRGYDSAGIAVLDRGEISVEKTEGKLAQLKPKLESLPRGATRGLGHTRWATHGEPNTTNAHPHVVDGIALVHNGIIENYEELKAELIGEGVRFQSQTDTEVVLHLFAREMRKLENVQAALNSLIGRLRGAFSLGIMLAREPDALYLMKLGSPLVIGAGRDENHFASDAMALVSHTSRAMFLNDREYARITESTVDVWSFDGKKLENRFVELDISSASVEKQGFRHFMLKEIHEQPRVLAAMAKRFVDSEAKALRPKEMGLEGLALERVASIAMVACGTAHYSCLLGKYMIENAAGIPVAVELASEFRYRDPVLDAGTLVIAVSQSGETADTLACIKHAKERGCQTFAICNVKMSSIARECHSALYMECGPEIGVASTKAFTAMLLSQFLFGLALGQRRGRVTQHQLDAKLAQLRNLPSLMGHAVDGKEPVQKIAEKYYEASNFIFIGRGASYAIALEGALKLKEISYIHAEGYAGGELKHGPIALIDRHMPVVALAPKDQWYEKMVSNIEEVKARQGRLITLGDPNDAKLKRLGEDFLPCVGLEEPSLAAIVAVVPLQLLAYYVAVRRGTDVDQPRNLAKSVTVE